jgi:hypothetical protein
MAASLACGRSPGTFAITCGGGAVRLSTADIKRYDWPAHVFWVHAFKRRLVFDASAGGRCEVLAYGQVAYAADVVSSWADQTRHNAAVFRFGGPGDPASGHVPIAVVLGWPTRDDYSGPDLRSHPSVLKALEEAGILVRSQPQATPSALAPS